MTFHRLKVCTLALFFTLSALDLALTFVILHLGGDNFRESNPVAGWALKQAGWLGLTSFKTGSVLAVTGCCFVIASWRPRLGNHILTFACASLLAVVGYSSALAGTSGIFCPHAREYEREVNEGSIAIEKKVAEAQAYANLYRQMWYEMLAGRVPFHSDTPLGYLRKHMLDDPPPFRAVAPGLPVPAELEAVVMKALAKERDQRYASTLEFAREFSRAASGQPTSEQVRPTVKVAVPSDSLQVEQKRLAQEKAAAERLAKERAEAERLEREKAEAERVAQEKAIAERFRREKAETEHRDQERVEAERVAQEKAIAERFAREKAEAERREREKAAAARQAQERAHAELRAKVNAEVVRVAREKAEEQRKTKAGLVALVAGLILAALAWFYWPSPSGSLLRAIFFHRVSH